MLTLSGLTDPIVQINGIVLKTVPNSIELVRGVGKVDVKAATLGGGTTIPVFLTDKTDAVGSFSFHIYPTVSDIELVQQLQDAGNNNVVTIIDRDSGFSLSSPAIKVACDDPNLKLGADQTIEVKCMGGTFA